MFGDVNDASFGLNLSWSGAALPVGETAIASRISLRAGSGVDMVSGKDMEKSCERSTVVIRQPGHARSGESERMLIECRILGSVT